MVDVDPGLVLRAFTRRWRAKQGEPAAWRIRGLAVIAVAISAPPGTTIRSLSTMLPLEILRLAMPVAAWRWVLRWLRTRRLILGPDSDHLPWVSFVGSRGMPKQIGWAASRTLERAGLPGWRLSKLLRSSWRHYPLASTFSAAASRLLPASSPMLTVAQGGSW